MTLLGGSEGSGESQGTQASGNQGTSTTTGTNTQGAGAAAATNTSASAPTSASSSWRDSLPEDLKTNAALALHGDVASLAKSYIHAQSLVGKKGVVPPTEKSSEEEWKNFYKSVGQPEFDKFDIKTPQDVEINADFVGKYKEVAHKMGLLPKQAQGMVDWYLQHERAVLAEQHKNELADEAASLAELRKEWGDGYDKEVNKALLAVKQVGGPDFQAYLDETRLGNDPRLIKFMSKVGALLGEDKIHGNGAGKFGQTPAEIQDELDKIRGDLKGPLYDSKHADHKRYVDRTETLYRKLADAQKVS